MIHEAYMPVYIGVQIFIAYGRAGGCAGPPEVVQEALADLKIIRCRLRQTHDRPKNKMYGN